MRDLACQLQDFIFDPSPQNIEKTKVVGSGHQVIRANPESIGVTRKIFFSKNLVASAIRASMPFGVAMI
jgi:hypothetical protein